jgi:hypothetical protein
MKERLVVTQYFHALQQSCLMASGTFGKLGLIGSWLGEHCDCNAGMVRQVTAAEGEDSPSCSALGLENWGI